MTPTASNLLKDDSEDAGAESQPKLKRPRLDLDTKESDKLINKSN